jgi:sarcosine oxidase subunit alpha
MDNDLRIMDHPLLKVDRGERIRFQFNGRAVTGYSGETIAAALYATGLRIFSRSFKYHRPRGLFCLSGHCSNCLMRVDGVPNVRTCVMPLHPGMKVESQNAWPSLQFDLAAVAGYLDVFIRPGFQYRRFIRSRRLYHIWERFLRNMAGIGSLADTQNDFPARRRRAEPEIVVVGGGMAGISAALHAARTGAEVWLIEKENSLGGRLLYDTAVVDVPDVQVGQHGFAVAQKLADDIALLNNCRIVTGATAFAWYEEGILAVSRPAEFWELRPQCIIVATGSYESPMVFENNDLPGVFLAGGLQRLMHRDFIRPGRKAVVITDNDKGYTMARQLQDGGVAVAGIVDNRREEEILLNSGARDIQTSGPAVYAQHEIQAAVGRRRVKGAIFKPLHSSKKIKLSCDVICIAACSTPANELVFQRTCEGAYILESPHQFSRRPLASPLMQVDKDMYVAGEASGSRDLKKIWLEGKLAGLSAAMDLGYGSKALEAERDAAASLAAEK